MTNEERLRASVESWCESRGWKIYRFAIDPEWVVDTIFYIPAATDDTVLETETALIDTELE